MVDKLKFFMDGRWPQFEDDKYLLTKRRWPYF